MKNPFRSETNQILTTGDNKLLEARMALVTSSETSNSAVSASARRPHSTITSLACSRAQGTAVGKALSSK
jgi:hypothetical protein